MTEVSALPILAYKVGPNLFDLSRNLHHVSIRDQVNRAISLAEGLISAKQLAPAHDEVLIVGAGVAGATVAIVLARHGVKTCLVDAELDPFSKQAGVHQRRIGPYMYEWPLAVFEDQRLPSRPPSALASWTAGATPPLGFFSEAPVPPGTMATYWATRLGQELANHKALLRIRMGIDRLHTLAQITAWLAAQRAVQANGAAQYAPHGIQLVGGKAWATSAPLDSPVQPRFVVLAAGMGEESNHLETSTGGKRQYGTRFWDDDKLRERNCGHPIAPRVVILGGGDGALQDTMRAMTGHADPLKTWKELNRRAKTVVLKNAMRQCAVFERQHADTLIWATSSARAGEMNRVLDSAYKSLAKKVARNAKILAGVSEFLCVRRLVDSD